MRMKKIAKLQNEILLNIQYFRLKEEISDTETKIDAINEKKDNALLKILGHGKQKKIEHNQSIISAAEKAIAAMEANNYKYDQSIIDKNLAMLRNTPNYDSIACQIAVHTVLDITVPYCNSDDYLEDISDKLFGDKTKIAAIVRQRGKAAKALNNTLFPIADGLESAILNGVQKIENNAGVQMVAGLIKAIKPDVVAKLASVAEKAMEYGGEKLSIIKRIKERKSVKKLDIDGFDYVLLTKLLLMDTTYSLQVERKIPKMNYRMSELGYQKYIIGKMKIVGKYRKSFSRDLYRKWKDRSENIEKMHLLCGFEDYVVTHLIPQEKR